MSKRYLIAKGKQAQQKGDKLRRLSLAYAQGSMRTKESSESRRIAGSRMSLEYTAYIQSPEWAIFRQTIFAERGRKCQECGSTLGEIHVHHKHYRTFRHERPRDVIVLCKPCHDALHRVLRCQ